MGHNITRIQVIDEYEKFNNSHRCNFTSSNF